MAIVAVPEENLTITDEAQIREYLGAIGIDYARWNVSGLGESATDDAILAAYKDEIDKVCARGGYTSVDVINVHSSTPGLDEMLAKFNREHWHDEDEVRFIIHGRGLFHLHPENKPVVAIEVGPGDMIRVPRGTHHWFNLCKSREIKAIRFFQDKSGWTPHYTNTTAERSYEPVCFGPFYAPPHSS